MRNRFFKTTLGVDAQVFVGKAIAYTSQATLALFQANAVDGEVGIYNAETNALISSGGAVAQNTKVLIAVKRGTDMVETSTPITVVTGVAAKVPYVAPVKHAITITTTGGSASKVIGDLTYYADKAGTAGNSITVTQVVAGNNTALSVSVSGTAITVNLATGGGGAATSTATQIAAAVNASVAASALVDAVVTGTGSTVQGAQSVVSLAGGVAEPTVSKGDYMEIVVVETTPGIEPLPRYNYSTEVKAGESFQDAITRLVAKISSSTSVENQNKTQVVTASTATGSGNDIVLTAVDYNSHFTVGLRGLLADYASFTVTSQFKAGSGVPGDVLIAESEGNIRKGVTTNYPIQNASAQEFGAPASAVDTAATYTTYKFGFFSSDMTRTLDREFRKNYVFLYVPSNGGANPDSALTTIFAL